MSCIKQTQKEAFARAELLAEADAATPLGPAHQDPSGLPHVVWADVVSRGPQSKALGREAAKERRKYSRARLGPSNVHLEREGCRASKKPEGTQLRSLQQVIREERRERPRGHQLDPLLPAPENSAPLGKRAIKTIRVDLRPLLQKVVEPLGSWQEDMSEGVPRGDGWPSSSRERSRGQDLRDGRVRGFLGGRRGDVGGGAEDHVDGKHGGIRDGEDHVDRNHGGPMDGDDHVDRKHGGIRDGEDHVDRKHGGPMDGDDHVDRKHGGIRDGEDHVDRKHGGPMDGDDHVDRKYGGIRDGDDHVDRKHEGIKDGEVHLDGKYGGPMDGEDLIHGRSHRTIMRTSIPSKVEGLLRDASPQSKANSLETLGLGPKNSKASKEIRPQLPRNNLLAVTMLQPQFSSPVSLPRILPKLPLPTEAESSTGRLAAPSPDFQIPTRLLLRRLQETTTSKNHRLIAGILSALREELSADGPKTGDPREKRNPFLDLPRIGPRISGTSEADFADGKKRMNSFPWKVR